MVLRLSGLKALENTKCALKPRAAHTSASEIPVVPAVYSTTVSRGRRRPSAAARSIMARATRSFMLPVGLADSSFTTMRADPAGARRLSSTSGVLPIAASTPVDDTLTSSTPRVSPPVRGLSERAAAAVVALEAVMTDEGRADPAGEPHDDPGEERRPEAAVEVKAREHPGHQRHHGGVQHEEKDPERHYGERERKNEGDRPHDGVHHAEEQACEEQRLHVVDAHAVHPAAREVEPEGGEQGPQQEPGHRAVPAPGCASASTLRRLSAWCHAVRSRKYWVSHSGSPGTPEPSSRTTVPPGTASTMRSSVSTDSIRGRPGLGR